MIRGLDPQAERNRIGEYLQARILESIQRAGAMSPLAFHGGTVMRFQYRLPRYSEELDFVLEGPRESYDPQRWLTSITAQFRREGYDTMTSLRDHGAVHVSPASSVCGATPTRCFRSGWRWIPARPQAP